VRPWHSCQEKAEMPHSRRHSKPGWMEPWATWSGGWQPCPPQGAGNRLALRFLSNPTCLRFCDSMIWPPEAQLHRDPYPNRWLPEVNCSMSWPSPSEQSSKKVIIQRYTQWYLLSHWLTTEGSKSHRHCMTLVSSMHFWGTVFLTAKQPNNTKH